jgi:hypothetical protein
VQVNPAGTQVLACRERVTIALRLDDRARADELGQRACDHDSIAFREMAASHEIVEREKPPAGVVEALHEARRYVIARVALFVIVIVRVAIAELVREDARVGLPAAADARIGGRRRTGWEGCIAWQRRTGPERRTGRPRRGRACFARAAAGVADATSPAAWGLRRSRLVVERGAERCIVELAAFRVLAGARTSAGAGLSLRTRPRAARR